MFESSKTIFLFISPHCPCFLLPPDDSVDWLLRCHRSSLPPHCCCDFFFLDFVLFLFSSPVVHITWFLRSHHSSNPLCSGMASGINQSISHFCLSSFSLSLSLSLFQRWGVRAGGFTSQLTVWGWFCVLSQDKQLFCVSQRHLALAIRDLSCPVNRLAVVFFGATVVVVTLPTLHKQTVDYS